MAKINENKFENLYRWASHKLKIQEKFNRNQQIKVKFPRGAIYGCYFGENVGFEKSKLESRPCLIVSTNRINYKSGNVIVVPLSGSIKYKKDSNSQLIYDWHYVLKSSKYKLKKDSVVQCEDIRCISKSRLGNFIDIVEKEDMNEIRKRIKSSLQL